MVLSFFTSTASISHHFFIDTLFFNNYGIRYGIIGVVGFSFASFNNNTFIENSAKYGGSIALISVTLIVLEELAFINSNARQEGGSIYFLKNNKITFANSMFDNSSSDSDAGCFSAREIEQFIVQNISVMRSSANFNGGVCYLIKIQNLVINYMVINNSSASRGGVLFVDEKTNVLINNSHFKSGHSLISGGFAFIEGDDMDFTILNSSFFNFISTQDAAIIISSNIFNLTVFSSNFSSSQCENGGLGIIYLGGYSSNEKFFNFLNNSFFNNSALYGANIYYTSNSNLNVINIISYFNQGSLFDLESDSGGFILISSSFFTFTNYYSSDWSLNSLFTSSKCIIIINDTKIISNNGTMHLFELIMETNLIFNNSIITDYFSMKLNKNENFEFNSKIFQILNSKLTSRNSIIGYSSKIWNPYLQCISFDIKESVFFSFNDTYENISSSDVPFSFNFFKSHIEMEKISMRIFNFLENIFVIKKSNFLLNNISIRLEPNISNNRIRFFIHFDGVETNNKEIFMKIINCLFLSRFTNVFFIRNIYHVEIIDCIFSALYNDQSNILGRAIDAGNFFILLIYHSIFQNYLNNDIASCILMYSELPSATVNIIKTNFLKNQAYSSSVLYVRGNITLFIEQCLFQENKALTPSFKIKNSGKGGCMLIDCEYFKNCFVFLNDSIFENNFASTIGPTILFKSINNITFSNITFKNNVASINFTRYFSSMPILNYILNQSFLKETIELYYQKYPENRQRTWKILSEYESSGNFTIASGQPFNFSFLVADAFNQQLISESDMKSALICYPSADLQNISRLIIDRSSALSFKGFFFFEKVSIIVKPYSILNCSITYQYSDDFIFQSTNILNVNLDRSIIINITFFVRECILGELYQVDETCFRCFFGTYALHQPAKIDPSKKCSLCPKSAYCEGGNYLSPLKGYWRKSNQSNLVHKCLNAEACLGVGDDVETIKKYKLFDNLTELQKIQGICRNEYKGNLCYYCQKGLARYKQNAPCQECDILVIIYFKMAMSIIFIVLYVSAQAAIFGNIEKEDPHFALLIKMILNHLQTISMMDLMDLGLTYNFDFYFSIKDYLSFLSEDFFVIDCLIQEMEGNLLVNKIIFTILLPLILSIFMFLIWFVTLLYYSFITKSSFTQKTYDFLVEKMRITLLIFVFILYPEILKKGFSLLNCIIIDEITNLEVLRLSPDIECWSAQHIFWVLTVSLPGIIFWGILSPLFITLIIMINKKHIYQFLGDKEYSSIVEIIKNDSDKKFIILKKTIINIEKDLADKLFFGRKPPLKIEIGYIKKKQVFIESKEIKILEQKELEQMINFPSLKKEFKVNRPFSSKKKSQLIPEDPIIYRNSEKIINKPEYLLKNIEIEIKDLKLTHDDLDINKVLVQEEYNIQYDYQKIIEAKKIFPSKIIFKIPLKNMIVIRNLGFVYRGYRKEFFFWEIVMFSRKFIFILIGKFNNFKNYELYFILVLQFIILFYFSY